MRSIPIWGMTLGLALVGIRGWVAQEPPEVWVSEIRAPQYFAVMVEDVDRAASWYQSAFGLQRLDDTEARDGRSRIVNLSSDQLFVEIIGDDRARDVERARGFFKVGFRVPDVDVVADRVERATGVRPEAIDFARHGVRILQLRDPEGNILQLSSSLSEPRG